MGRRMGGGRGRSYPLATKRSRRKRVYVRECGGGGGRDFGEIYRKGEGRDIGVASEGRRRERS